MTTETITSTKGTDGRVPHVNADQYLALYQKSVTDPDAFWAEQGKRLD